MASNSVLLDGKWTRGFYAGRGRKSHPFAQNGDYNSIIVVREFRQSEHYFVPGRRGVDKDPVYSDAYLILESDPEPIGMGDAISVIRTYARIPSTQTVPSSIFVNKPEISGEFPQTIGSFLVFQPDATVASYDGYLTKTVTSDSGPVSGAYPTGGTYTLSFDGGTTGATAYDASAATVETALDALTGVTDRGGVSVSGSYNSTGGIVVTFADYAVVTIDGSLLTSNFGNSPINNTTTSNGGYTQSVNYGFTSADQWNGGTFTLTLFGQTTAAIAYNATAADVQTALNLLTEVQDRGNCTVTVPSGQTTILSNEFGGVTNRKLIFTIGFANAAITANVASLTPAGSSISVAIDAVGRVQTITFLGIGFARTVYAAAHGISNSDDIYVKADDSYVTIDAGDFSINDANTVALTVTPGSTVAAATSVTEIGKLAVENYKPGADNVFCNRVTYFYLPGVTPGISSAADIPLPERQNDAASFLQAIFEGDTSINYDVGELEQWMGSPILAHTVITVNASQL